MSLLFKNLRIHQIFGANTDVGKTVLTSALVRASAALGKAVYYLKPVSTGPLDVADDEHVKRFAGRYRESVDAACLFRFDEPVSPHLAARLAQEQGKREVTVPSDETFANAVAHHIRQCATRMTRPSHMYVETAGGVHSPTLSGTTQLDSYRPLFLPTVLIGDSKLGGISSTISSYESLLLRGYIVDAIMLFRDEYYRNWEYLSPYFAERGVHVVTLDPPPERHADRAQDVELTDKYYEHIVPSTQQGGIFDAIQHLDNCHAQRLTELETMPRRTLDTIWWPFVQHGLVKSEADVNVLDSASGDFFSVYNGRRSSPSASPPALSAQGSPKTSLLEPQFDGSASWWTQAVGHAHPELALAAARAAGRYGHVMFPQGTHLPALKLAERLVHDGPGKGWASRAFFSDDGSTGMEVALKMALRAYTVKHGLDKAERKHLGILGLKGSYHGDTIGAMDACEEGVYTCEWHEAKGFWFDPPTVAIRKGKAAVSLPPALAELAGAADAQVDTRSLAHTYDVAARLQTPLAGTYRAYIERTLQKLKEKGGPTIAALVLEPLVMGAGGMIFVDPLFQRVLIDVVRGTYSSVQPRPASQWAGLPVIFDEVFVGLYRLGLQSTAPLLGTQPDIAVNAKILTGGLVPLAVTMASDSIFQAFMSEAKVDALLHGHSYTAYPVGCEVANATLEMIDKLAECEEWNVARHAWKVPESPDAKDTAVWSFWDPEFVNAVSHLDSVNEVMAFGTVLSIKVKDTSGGYQSHSAQKMLESIKTGLVEDKLSSAPGGAPFGINYRTLGDVAYFMLSLNTPAHTARSVEERIWSAIKN
ncbi:hypothetical protein CERSUDRAFT_118053 [Gelatoporia subvermispora B]|uniref:Dethiobiotin synthase n=1 Tax=Ceriporiopsis subvermispora (strain B) TaxID=914234 RepID=M2QMU4_CERS8|nr:hypothetical protein CERSUDRAFT_118053 [Gelatoporia subvermispora B]